MASTSTTISPFIPTFLTAILTLLLFLPTTTHADVSLTSPKAGETITGGSTITVKWEDSGSKPKLSEFTSFSLFLCMGSNKNPLCTVPLGSPGSKMVEDVTQAKVQIPAAAAGNGKGVFFIAMEAVSATGGLTRNFTPRFSLTSMSGLIPASALAEQKLGDTSPPPRFDSTSSSSSPNADNEDIPYEKQTGPTRYAPMQTQPGNKIKEKGKVERLHPTSSYSVFKRKMAPTPNAVTTMTKEWDYKVTSVVNRASPAPRPREAKERYMARWRD